MGTVDKGKVGKGLKNDVGKGLVGTVVKKKEKPKFEPNPRKWKRKRG